jgi:dipeptidyl aminopeptidase/acylaminoacyl peptidase
MDPFGEHDRKRTRRDGGPAPRVLSSRVTAGSSRSDAETVLLAVMPTRRAFLPADLRRQVVLEELDLSSDGRLAVVGRRGVRGDEYVAHLWAIPLAARGAAAKARPLTSGLVLDRQPAISPDGGLVAWIRSWPDDDDRPSAIQLMSTRGGRIREVRAGQHGSVDSVAWSPDGTRLAFTASVDPPRFVIGKRRPLSARTRRGAKAPDEPSPIARRITRIDWRLDEVGHIDHWSHLFVVDARSGARPRQVTAGDWGVSQIAWHPDGRTVAFTADRGADADLHPRPTIWSVDVDADAPEPREVLAPRGWATRPAYSADGRWLAAVGILEPEPLDDVSPTLLIGPSDGSRPPRAIAADLDRPFGNWTDCDLTGWMVESRPGPRRRRSWPVARLVVHDRSGDGGGRRSRPGP